ncbi:hypothetical protein [Streptomyces canus]|uniref:hypothetical protein n=1 Tax=Streptomyces canus TaxID=58343 RepID=UPI00386E2453|nr:hypothetical protein OH824_34820 [Streptomyces canus]
MTLEEHARAIEAAIQAAAEDGFYLDNGSGIPPGRLDLNSVDEREDPLDWVELRLPTNPLA